MVDKIKHILIVLVLPTNSVFIIFLQTMEHHCQICFPNFCEAPKGIFIVFFYRPWNITYTFRNSVKHQWHTCQHLWVTKRNSGESGGHSPLLPIFKKNFRPKSTILGVWQTVTVNTQFFFQIL